MKIQHLKICRAELKLRGKYKPVNVYIRKQEKSQTNHLSSYLKNLEKEEQNKSKANRRKAITTHRSQ